MDKRMSSILILLLFPAYLLGRKMASIFSKYGSEKLDFRVYTRLTFLLVVSLIALILFSFPLVDKSDYAWRISEITDSFCLAFIIFCVGDWLKFSQKRNQKKTKEDERNE